MVQVAGLQLAFVILSSATALAAAAAAFALLWRRARRRIDALQREFLGVFEVTDCAVIITDPAGLIVNANYVFANFCGCDRMEIESKLMLEDCLDGDYRLDVLENHRLMRQYPDSARRRYRARLRNRMGNTREVLITEALIPGTSNCISSMQDISAARMHEWIARESTSKYQSIFDNVSVGIFQTTTDGRYLSANRTLAQIYGFETGDQLIHGLTDISKQLYVDPLQRERFKQAMEEREIIADFESEVYRIDGSTVWIRENARVVRDHGGRFLYYEGIVEDITKRRVAELELRRAESEVRAQNHCLEQALGELRAAQSKLIEQGRLHALGQMASGIAHDFNNALSPILGYSDLLLKQPDLLLKRDRALRSLQMIHTCARDAASIVRKLRNLYRSKPRADRLKPINVTEIVAQSIELTQPRWRNQALEAGTQIEVLTQFEEIPSIQGDETELREVMTNLIFNAVDALPGGGRITIRLRPEHEAIVLEVEDNGKGMALEVRSRCFEPFFTTKGERGTGLGLPMVPSVIARHGGKIEVESEPDRFTRFRIRLPLAARNLAQIAEGQDAIPMRRAQTVLAIDDEQMILDIVRDFLELDGSQVTTILGSQPGLAAYQPGAFDLVILDQGMPGMSGDRVAEHIKALDPAQPILMLTGFGDLMLARGEIPASVDWVISKPITRERLVRGIAHALHTAETAKANPDTTQPATPSMEAMLERAKQESLATVIDAQLNLIDEAKAALGT